MRVVLDSEALSSLIDEHRPRRESVLTALEAARRMSRPVVVPAVVLAEVCRGKSRSTALDALLSREPVLVLRDTDLAIARAVGAILHTAKANSDDIVDAHCVATAIEVDGRGVVITGDADDIERLAAPFPGVAVVGL